MRYREDDNILGAVMSGSEYVPTRGTQNESIVQGGTGRFKTHQPKAPGTTSQAGVKVVKGISLKDAFKKK